jgi:hypothetical protein
MLDCEVIIYIAHIPFSSGKLPYFGAENFRAIRNFINHLSSTFLIYWSETKAHIIHGTSPKSHSWLVAELAK